MSTTIQVKRSDATPTPATLAPGEPAFSFASRTLFIGNSSNVPVAVAGTGMPISSFAAATANVSMGNNRLINLANPTGAQDAVTLGFAQTNFLAAAGGVINGNVTVTGNLTVQGTQTTIESATLQVADNTIVVNANQTGAPTLDGGIEVERGDSTNVSFLWDETNDQWTLGNQRLSGLANATGAADAINLGQADGRYVARSTFTGVGSLLYGNGAGAAVELPGNSTAVKQFLTSTGTGSAASAPVWAAMTATDLPTVPVIKGGTGLTAVTTGSLLYASAANTLAQLNIGSSGQVLRVSSGGVPEWTSSLDGGTF